MEIVLSPQAKEHIDFWNKTGNRQILNKIKKLIDSILESPYEGIGKPEQLKYELSGYWSRRINEEHRIVYKVENNTIYFIAFKGHY